MIKDYVTVKENCVIVSDDSSGIETKAVFKYYPDIDEVFMYMEVADKELNDMMEENDIGALYNVEMFKALYPVQAEALGL